MIILALDTSAEACSVALWKNRKVDGIFEFAPQQQSQILLPMIQSLLDRHQMKLQDCSAIAFAEGPGSFTGLRIAAGVAQGLAFAHQLPLIPISTLAALSWAAHQKQPACSVIIPAIDARMGEIYFALYEILDEMLQVRIDDGLAAPEAAAKQLEQSGLCQHWVGIGSGFDIYQEALAEFSSSAIHLFPQALPDAKDVAMLAVRAYEQGCSVAIAEALPKYIRNKVTEAR